MPRALTTVSTKLHHVVICVHPENIDRAAKFWRDLGVEFEEILLPEISLRVVLSWEAGIELITPIADTPAASAFTAFLAERGEGVYSVVIGVPEHASAVEVARRYGAEVRFHQRRDAPHHLEETDLRPFYGMPVTFLTTDRPL